MPYVQLKSAMTRSFAQRYLRIGSTSLFVSAAVLAAYILWNVDLLHKSWTAEDFDDALLICLMVLNTFTAFSLRRAAKVVAAADQERFSAERNAERHRLWLETVVRQMPVGIGVLVNPSGDLVLSNDQFRHLTMPDVPAAWQPSRGGEERPHRSAELARELSRHVLEQGEIIRDQEIELCRGDGKETWISASAAPIRDGFGGVAGAVVIFSDITERKAAAMERAVLMRGIINAQENERLRIARELHDELGQDITGLCISLKALQSTVAGDGNRETIRMLQATVEGMNDRIHALISRLRPLMLDDFGLRHALEELALAWSERLGVHVDVQLDDLSSQLSDAISIAVYRVVQEALTNIAKHADARSVSVTTQLRGGALRVVVEDDGKGFETGRMRGAGSRRFGIAGMAERLNTVGGRLDVESRPGLGTTIYASLPHEGTVLEH